jgi:hypothetical protein
MHAQGDALDVLPALLLFDDNALKFIETVLV